MMSESTVELINLAVDEQASPAQQAELAEILRNSPEARIALDSIRDVVQSLEAAPPFEAPPSLKNDVLDAIRATRAERPDKRPWLGVFGDVDRRWSVLAAWTAVAAVVLVIAFLPQVRSGSGALSPAETTGVSGAMTRVQASSTEVARATSSTRELRIAIRRDVDRLVLQSTTRDAAEITFSWDPAKLALDGPEKNEQRTVGALSSMTIHCTSTRCPELLFRPISPAGAEISAASSGGDNLRLTIPDR